MKKEYTYEVNGFPVKAVYDEKEIQGIFLPLLRRWNLLQKKKDRRILIFLSAPPGTGKTTLTEFLAFLSRREPGVEELQAIGLDGFHYPQNYILTHSIERDGKQISMKEVKGCPETFDTGKLKEKLELLVNGQQIRWPVYDRKLHDVVEEVTVINKKIVLLEGNWLLSSEMPWAELAEFCDDSVFIGAEEGFLRERLIQRKQRGGYAPSEAVVFYEKSDSKNIRRLMDAHQKAAVQLEMQSDGSYVWTNKGGE